jgi:glycosyltransferase involved in cell wall biosynthesis
MPGHTKTAGRPVAASYAVRRMLRRPARFVRRSLLPKLLPPAKPAILSSVSHVRIVGLLSSASGIGKSGRLCAEALAHDGISVSLGDVGDLFAARDGISSVIPGGSTNVPQQRGITIYHLNPSMLLPGILRSGFSRYRRSYNIGYWAWELETLPREWIEAIRFVHAILVPSRFCQAAIQRYTSKPVLVVPHPVPRPTAADVMPIWRQSTFTVINVFRFGSSFERKNPIALIKAFRLAFGSDAGTQLILKTSDGAHHPGEFSRLADEIGQAGNIRLIDEVWDEQRMNALMRSANAYVSLHRSEGFGLPLAEAIMLGTPVIATHWSGNTDFCLPAYTYPLGYTLTALRDTHPDYQEVVDAQWAEPSIEDAVRQLRRVRENPGEARQKAQRARQALEQYLHNHTYGRALHVLARIPEGAVDPIPASTPMEQTRLHRHAP